MTQTNQENVYFTLTGQIDPQIVQRVFHNFALTTQQPSQPNVHLLLHSTGGFISDGICLYNYLRSLPINLTAYNVGGVSSIAVVVFLAAQRRIASASASFMIHRSHATPPSGVGPDVLKSIADSLVLDDRRMESILRGSLQLPPEKWEIHSKADLHLSATEALSAGLIHDIADFTPPAGCQVFNI